MITESCIELFVRDTIKEITAIPFDTIARDRRIPEVAGDAYDSLAVVELITAVEEQFGIEVDFVVDDVRYRFDTLERIVDFIASKRRDLAVLEE